MPLKSGEGAYAADAGTLDGARIRRSGGRPLPGQSQRLRAGIAGVSDEAGNVVGLMPHPEYATSELTGPGTDRARLLFLGPVSVLVGA